MSDIDKKDELIIQLLQGDAWQSSEALAKKLKVSSATIRRRTKKLVKNGTLQVGAFVDPAKIGRPLGVLIALNVNHNMVEKVANELAKNSKISWISSTTGRFDLLLFARFASTDELANFVQHDLPQMEGVKASETFISLRVNKGYYVPLT